MNFDQKASIYEKISISQKVAADHLFSMMEIDSDDEILDAGCGTGYLTELLNSCANKTKGIDISSEMIKQAKELRPHIDFSVFNAEELNSLKKYDWIITNAVTYYFKDLKGTIGKFYEALKPNGKYAVQAQTKVTPQFINAMADLLDNKITQEYYKNFKLLINHLNINEFLSLLMNAGFIIKKAEMINYKNQYSIEDAFNIFKSGTATPFLNPMGYGKEKLSEEYINKFWDIAYNGLVRQAVDGKIILDVPRCFIIVERPLQ